MLQNCDFSNFKTSTKNTVQHWQWMCSLEALRCMERLRGRLQQSKQPVPFQRQPDKRESKFELRQHEACFENLRFYKTQSLILEIIGIS